MASTHKSLRSSTANKRPTTAIADGQIALNTNSTSPGLFFKDSTGATIIKVGPVHVGATAPNASPAAGGSAGNSTGEVWLDNSLTPVGVKIWDGSAWVNATPAGSTTVQGLLELATNAETQAGSDAVRAVTPAGLQSKVSDSTSTTSSTTIASSTAVKAAYDLANAALPKAGGTVTGNLEIGTTGSLTFEGTTADGFETTLAVVDPTADRTITLPNVTGTVITTGDTGTVTSTMIADGTIVDADVNASAAIGLSKLATGALPTGITVASANIVDGTIVDADISGSAEIAVSKLADGAARQLLQTDAAGTGVEWTDNVDIPGTLDVTGAATFDSSANITGNFTVDTGTLYVDATNNRVGVGTTSPTQALHVVSATTNNIFIETTSNSTRALFSATGKDSGGNDVTALFGPYGDGPLVAVGSTTNHDFRFITNNTERARIDSSGRLLVGTSSSPTGNNGQFARFVVQGQPANNSAGANISIQRGEAAAGGNITAGEGIGNINWSDNAGNTFAIIGCEADANAGTNDYPGRLVFSTTADGASAPTERMRITKDGSVFLGNTTYSATTNMVGFGNLAPGDTQAQFLVANTEATDTAALAVFNRHASDGRLVQFRQANTTEGTISVSGTTVTYGGGHLARWSQLPNDEDPSSILKGTVMSNLDEMCEWGDEDNEQLNKTKISNVEGDPNVAGVFVATSFDEEGPMDFFVAMTGDMVIRIAAGTTVQRGDLLMSAGDGTAKPQDDDIIRSKTIAKVTSTNVSCTYDDGSYCVPCVLMAC